MSVPFEVVHNGYSKIKCSICWSHVFTTYVICWLFLALITDMVKHLLTLNDQPGEHGKYIDEESHTFQLMEYLL